MNDEAGHIPVLLSDVLNCLSPERGETMVDATFGGGGHAVALAERVGREGRVVGIDQDPEVIARSEEFRRRFPSPLDLVHGNFRNLPALLADVGAVHPNGVLLDLGVASMQLDQARRGFSFRFDEALDMRMDTTQDITAADLLNDLPEAELARAIREYGEERFARRIARAIVRRREESPLRTTGELRELVHRAIPRKAHPKNIDAATRTFQALRIAVNDELGALEDVLEPTLELLAPGGRFAVISYHSLEDRIVKRAFQRASGQCLCPPNLPACQCGAREMVERITRRPLTPSEDEIARNPRARSAKLRAVRKLP